MGARLRRMREHFRCPTCLATEGSFGSSLIICERDSELQALQTRWLSQVKSHDLPWDYKISILRRIHMGSEEIAATCGVIGVLFVKFLYVSSNFHTYPAEI